MKVIIRKGVKYSLVKIPESELENTINCNDEVISDFSIIDEQQKYIEMGVDFIYDKGIILGDITNAQIALQAEQTRQLKAEKKQAIDNVASLSDQLNLMAGILYKLTDGTTDVEILAARAKFEEIQTILNK